jgi:hypothetical protein
MQISFRLISQNRVLREKLIIITQLLKTYPILCGTQSFVIMFSLLCTCYLYWVKWIKSILSGSISLRFILILFFHSHTRLWNVLFPLDSLNKILSSFLIPSIWTTCTISLVSLNYIVTYLGVCVTYRRVLEWWPDLLRTYATCYYSSQTIMWHTMSSLLHHLRLPFQETPSVLIQPALHPRYIASGRPQQKSRFPNSPSIVIEVCLPRSCIETAVLLLLRACSFPRGSVYLVVA